MDLSIKTEMKKGAVSKPSPEGSDTSQRAGLLPADKSAHPAGTEKTGCHSTYVPANSRATSALKNTEHFNPETQPLLEKNRGFPSAAQPRAGSKESSSPQSLAEMKRSLVTPPSNKQSHLVAGGIEDTRSVELF
ncbi:hypothetical protein GCK32_013256 [Trichostrongylus colubriformis]|uniref:Uncharacterized protein n=1 Tax=Trichostrongylus colubriformis TaxID=6319 RepID=A0AAN8FQ26_TRICO